MIRKGVYLAGIMGTGLVGNLFGQDSSQTGLVGKLNQLRQSIMTNPTRKGTVSFLGSAPIPIYVRQLGSDKAETCDKYTAIKRNSPDGSKLIYDVDNDGDCDAFVSVDGTINSRDEAFIDIDALARDGDKLATEINLTSGFKSLRKSPADSRVMYFIDPRDNQVKIADFKRGQFYTCSPEQAKSIRDKLETIYQGAMEKTLQSYRK